MFNKFRISWLLVKRNLMKEILTFLSCFDFLLSLSNLFNDAIFSKRENPWCHNYTMMSWEETPKNIYSMQKFDALYCYKTFVMEEIMI